MASFTASATVRLFIADMPGGAPISLATLCFSWYSDMSMRTMLSSLSNSALDSALAIFGLTDPGRAMNMNEPIGLRGSLQP